MVLEELSIPGELSFPLSIWVRAWALGSGSISWSWDGTEDCEKQLGGSICVPCEKFTCPNSTTSVCYGGYEPLCIDDKFATQIAGHCDDYKENDIQQPCTEIEIPLPTTFPTSSIPNLPPTYVPTNSQSSKAPTTSQSPTISPTRKGNQGRVFLMGVGVLTFLLPSPHPKDFRFFFLKNNVLRMVYFLKLCFSAWRFAWTLCC